MVWPEIAGVVMGVQLPRPVVSFCIVRAAAEESFAVCRAEFIAFLLLSTMVFRKTDR